MTAIAPDLDRPTPTAEVAELSPADRQTRLSALIKQSFDIYTTGRDAYREGRTVVATCLLFSGGNDSTTLGHLFRNTCDHAIHANTGIGIEQTRQFVRDTCAAWGMPLIEKHAPVSYRELVLEFGFPGPAMHWKMYQRLKERCVDAARAELLGTSRKVCIVLVAGRRRSESERRKDVPLYERDGRAIWVSPFANWTKLDLGTYRALHKVPRNEVSDLIHMSGECLCGSFARPGELDEIGYWFPDTAAEIRALQEEVAAAGWTEPLCTWGHGLNRKGIDKMRVGLLCSSCELPPVAS